MTILNGRLTPRALSRIPVATDIEGLRSMMAELSVCDEPWTAHDPALGKS
ncbi:MAG: hypothetical protein ACI8QZ_003067 [Chlamydiales bacterium]|jgi:hypothetical protein